jgi:electron transfer flavoprotein alpha subunit
LFEYAADEVFANNLDGWSGIAVYIDHTAGTLHPVSAELIGKARELAAGRWPVTALFIGGNEADAERLASRCGADRLYAYCHPDLQSFLIEPYTNVFESFINETKPASILVGATVIGRSLAPRVAARFRTGLTADCTELEMTPSGALIQIRPAFGGNIMARIVTPNRRPQMATVRYKVFDAPAPVQGHIKVIRHTVDDGLLRSRVKSLGVTKKELKPDIADADVIVACGRAFKSAKDLGMAYELAELLSGSVACTRPLIEAGWFDATRQIGLSGRTVKPRLIFTLGVSGAVQFKAGMQNTGTIVAVNADRNAPIMDICHHAVIGDIYEIVPQLIKLLKDRGEQYV